MRYHGTILKWMATLYYQKIIHKNIFLKSYCSDVK